MNCCCGDYPPVPPALLSPRIYGATLAVDYANGGAFTDVLSIAVVTTLPAVAMSGMGKGVYFPNPAKMRLTIDGVQVGGIVQMLANALGECISSAQYAGALAPGAHVFALQAQQVVFRPVAVPNNEAAALTVIEGYP